MNRMERKEESCESKRPDLSGQSDDIRKHGRSQKAIIRSTLHCLLQRVKGRNEYEL
jgi:hypothetical protein